MSDAIIALRENYARILSAIKTNDALISKCIQGSVQIKRISGSAYYYLQFRNGRKIESKYLGPAGSYNITPLEKEIARRKTMEKDNQRLRKEAANMKRMLTAVGAVV